jgi:drug/metabolite transporter (DMT)-like permease
LRLLEIIMPIPFLGELAALATSLFFSIGPTFFTLAGRLVGSAIVNRSRLLVATVILIALHFVFFGELLPLSADPTRWWWLGLSGVIGLSLGDAALFQAFVQLGARLTMLIFSVSPVLSAILAWLFLNETLAGIEMLGIAVTVAGVLWVVSENQNGEQDKADRSLYKKGLFFAFLGAVGQATGLITAKLGLYGDFSALSGQVIRMLVATIAIWLFTIFAGKGRQTLEKIRNTPLSARYILLGAIFGPVIGVYLSLVAVQFAPVGIASTLMALPPVFLIPIDRIVFGNKVSPRAILGTVIALSGVAILFLS